MKKLTLILTLSLGLAPMVLAASSCSLEGQPVLAEASATPQDLGTAEEDPPKRITFEHRAFSSLLERHVRGETVDYPKLNRDRAMLDMYVIKTAAVTPEEMKTWDRAERMAFWINVYNAYTLQLILDNYDQGEGKRLTSIKMIWDDYSSAVANNAWHLPIIPMPAFHPDGEKKNLTLDQIENRILRPQFGDARIHAALNCAAVGCPPLLAEAFTGEKLEEQLAAQMTAFMAGTSRNTFNKADKKITLSSIFDWYGDDFKTEATAAKRATDLRDYLIANGPESAGETPKDRAWIRDAEIEFGEYDWKLNDFGGK